MNYRSTINVGISSDIASMSPNWWEPNDLAAAGKALASCTVNGEVKLY